MPLLLLSLLLCPIAVSLSFCVDVYTFSMSCATAHVFIALSFSFCADVHIFCMSGVCAVAFTVVSCVIAVFCSCVGV